MEYSECNLYAPARVGEPQILVSAGGHHHGGLRCRRCAALAALNRWLHPSQPPSQPRNARAHCATSRHLSRPAANMVVLQVEYGSSKTPTTAFNNACR